VNRVLLLIKGLGRGGAEQLLVNSARYLDLDRFHCEVAYLLSWKDSLVGELGRPDYRATALTAPATRPGSPASKPWFATAGSTSCTRTHPSRRSEPAARRTQQIHQELLR
jgi:hypothetical protein